MFQATSHHLWNISEWGKSYLIKLMYKNWHQVLQVITSQLNPYGTHLNLLASKESYQGRRECELGSNLVGWDLPFSRASHSAMDSILPCTPLKSVMRPAPRWFQPRVCAFVTMQLHAAAASAICVRHWLLSKFSSSDSGTKCKNRLGTRHLPTGQWPLALNPCHSLLNETGATRANPWQELPVREAVQDLWCLSKIGTLLGAAVGVVPFGESKGHELKKLVELKLP